MHYATQFQAPTAPKVTAIGLIFPVIFAFTFAHRLATRAENGFLLQGNFSADFDRCHGVTSFRCVNVAVTALKITYQVHREGDQRHPYVI